MIVRLSDVVNRVNNNIDRFNTPIKYYLGKGHGECGEIAITEHGNLKEDVGMLGFKFHFAFQPGDSLFFSRSFALRKAGMATYEGICSDSTYILRSKNNNVLLSEYLPAVIQSDDFWEYCDTHHTGGVNFLINWSTLADYEFDLPSLEEQKVLAEKLWAAYDVKQSYLKMIEATEEMVKSQFIEMFGEAFSTNRSILLSEMVAEERPITYGVIKPGDFVDDGVILIRVKDLVDGKIASSNLCRIKESVAQNYKRSMLSAGDILLSIRGTIGRTAIVPEELTGANITQDTARISLKKSYNCNFIKCLLDSPIIQDWIKLHVRGLAVKGINLEDIRKIPIPIVEKDLQEKYIEIKHQADKSISELRKSVDAIDKVIKSLINENL
jgi:type I restriction enzyme S subunit